MSKAEALRDFVADMKRGLRVRFNVYLYDDSEYRPANYVNASYDSESDESGITEPESADESEAGEAEPGGI